MIERAKTRSYGVDIARCLAMFMVVVLHNLSNGGVLRTVQISSLTGAIYWGIEDLAIVAVNLFAMISGYLLICHDFQIKKIIYLWIKVLFWSVSISLVYFLFFNHSSLNILIKSFLPFSTNTYWYFNAYVMLFLFIPFLNAGISKLSIHDFRIIVLILLVLSMTIGLIGNWFEIGGYSGVWLMIMYLMGALIKVDPFFKTRGSISSFFFYLVFTCLTLIFEYFSARIEYSPFHWINYLSPFVVIASIFLFISLVNLRIKGEKITKFLRIIAPLTFAVYLIDNHPVIFNYLIKNSFIPIVKSNSIFGIPMVLGISAIIFIACILLEYCRVCVFRAVSALLKK